MAEHFISVDIETSGPIPGKFSLLSIGACVVGDENLNFYSTLRPLSEHADSEAMRICGFTLEDLITSGVEPAAAMENFRDWIVSVSANKQPVFVGLNAPFDWSFINYYFHFFLGSNPFGFAALDLKAYYMGAIRCQWRETSPSAMSLKLQPRKSITHNALDDALFQAELFKLLQVHSVIES